MSNAPSRLLLLLLLLLLLVLESSLTRLHVRASWLALYVGRLDWGPVNVVWVVLSVAGLQHLRPLHKLLLVRLLLLLLLTLGRLCWYEKLACCLGQGVMQLQSAGPLAGHAALLLRLHLVQRRGLCHPAEASLAVHGCPVPGDAADALAPRALLWKTPGPDLLLSRSQVPQAPHHPQHCQAGRLLQQSMLRQLCCLAQQLGGCRRLAGQQAWGRAAAGAGLPSGAGVHPHLAAGGPW